MSEETGDPPTGDLEEGEIYTRTLLDDEDDSLLSIAHQEISQDLRTHTPEQLFRRIQHDNEESLMDLYHLSELE